MLEGAYTAGVYLYAGIGGLENMADVDDTMKTELYKAIEAIDIEKLDNDDKEELIKIFMGTQNSLIRNHIALIFSDLNYDKAVPYLIEKINKKGLYSNNGTLVFALISLNPLNNFIDIVNIICTQDYEARLSAYDFIEDNAKSVSESDKNKALKIFESFRIKEGIVEDEKYKHSRLQFVEASISALKN